MTSTQNTPGVIPAHTAGKLPERCARYSRPTGAIEAVPGSYYSLTRGGFNTSAFVWRSHVSRRVTSAALQQLRLRVGGDFYWLPRAVNAATPVPMRNYLVVQLLRDAGYGGINTPQALKITFIPAFWQPPQGQA